MSRIISYIKVAPYVFFEYFFRLFPIKRNKVFISNYMGKGYGDNAKYIVEALLKQNNQYKIVWVVKQNYVFPTGVHTVNKNNFIGWLRSIYDQTTAKVWIDNCRKGTYVRKRKKQFYIQTWHGDIALKKIEGDAMDTLPAGMRNLGIHDSQMANLFVAGNKWMYNTYKRAFWYDGEIALCGCPRRDILYTKDNSIIQTIRHNLKLNDEVHLVIYVPTFRIHEMREGVLGDYITKFNWIDVLGAFERRFGGQWIGLVRLHPNVSHLAKDLTLPNNVIDVTEYPDINELLLISDCCISDYSSSLFEFGVTKKPGFLYAPDLDNYNKERGVYFKLDDIPFPVSKNYTELIYSIENFSDEEYLYNHMLFYDGILQMCENGHASEAIASRIENVCFGC